jgi:manganese efflux pump family protein
LTLLGWFLLALPLALDVFACGLVFGLAGLARTRWLGVALTFAAIGGVMMTVGLLLGETLEGALGTVALYVAGLVLLAIGLRSIGHGVGGSNGEGATPLDTRRIAATTLAVAVDKLAVGLSFSVLDAPASAIVIIVAAQAFVAGLTGLALGKQLGTRAGDAAEIIAGLVFVGLGLVILYQAFTG